jgi:hypothetical protein
MFWLLRKTFFIVAKLSREVKSVARKEMLPLSPTIVSKASLSISAVIIDAALVILECYS